MKFWMMPLAAALLSLPVMAQAQTCTVQVGDPFIRVPPKSAAAGAGFLTLVNTCAQDDKLLAVRADVSKLVELHTHVHDGDVMRMRKVESITVPANGVAELKPGGDHIMFITLTKSLKEGDVVPVTLEFAKAGKVEAKIPVVGLGATGALPPPPPGMIPAMPGGGAMPMDHGAHMKH